MRVSYWYIILIIVVFVVTVVVDSAIVINIKIIAVRISIDYHHFTLIDLLVWLIYWYHHYLLIISLLSLLLLALMLRPSICCHQNPLSALCPFYIIFFSLTALLHLPSLLISTRSLITSLPERRCEERERKKKREAGGREGEGGGDHQYRNCAPCKSIRPRSTIIITSGFLTPGGKRVPTPGPSQDTRTPWRTPW